MRFSSLQLFSSHNFSLLLSRDTACPSCHPPSTQCRARLLSALLPIVLPGNCTFAFGQKHCLSSSRLKAEAAPAMPPGKRAKPSVRSLMTDCAKEEAHVHLQFTTVTPRWCQSLSQYKTHFSWFLPSTGSKQSVLHGKALHPRGLSCTQTTTHPGSLFAYPSV